MAVSKAYVIPACGIEAGTPLEEALNWLFQIQGPSLLEVPLSMQSKVYPKLAFGRRFGEMEPEAKPRAMEST